MKLGFIGLGILGAPMAGHLLAAGHELFAQSRSGVPQALLDAGAKVCKTASALQMMNSCAAHGGAQLDHSSLVRALEIAGHFQVAQG